MIPLTDQNIQIELLTPVHIGSGQDKVWHRNIDFFYDKGKVYVIYQDDLLKSLLNKPNGKQELTNFSTKLASDNLEEIRKYIFNHFDIKELAYLIFDAKKSPSKDIKPFLRTGLGKPILAGSSLKGSIRTALLNYLIKSKPMFAKQEDNLGRRRGNKMFYSDKHLQGNYLGKEPKNDLLRMLHVSDFELDESKTILYETQTLNLYGNSWNVKKNVSSFLECANVQTINGKIHIPKEQINNNKASGVLKNTELLDFQALFKIINNHTLHLLEEEVNFWNNEIQEADIIDMVYDYKESLEEVFYKAKNLNTNNSCILRVGAGSGWDFMTGAWTKDVKILSDKAWENLKYSLRKSSYFNSPFPKSRKTVGMDKALPLGFIKLSLLNQ